VFEGGGRREGGRKGEFQGRKKKPVRTFREGRRENRIALWGGGEQERNCGGALTKRIWSERRGGVLRGQTKT